MSKFSTILSMVVMFLILSFTVVNALIVICSQTDDCINQCKNSGYSGIDNSDCSLNIDLGQYSCPCK
ncbi:hypothetical protein GWI33_008538 [Rhynchophorus ferrugineus]|uniref:Uncharacterized protein n=1 Tax=Rhynchophorus ferrugineus TaxID=354439 RepID=A0A834IQV6_RHYFE|nr:hypothetical protein GWI33_008538 [Rhynchophorus ferrugineus]